MINYRYSCFIKLHILDGISKGKKKILKILHIEIQRCKNYNYY